MSDALRSASVQAVGGTIQGMTAAPVACRGPLWHLAQSSACACLSQRLVGAENLPKIGFPLCSQQCSCVVSQNALEHKDLPASPYRQ